MTEDAPLTDGGTAAPSERDVRRAGDHPPEVPDPDDVAELLPRLLGDAEAPDTGFLIRASLDGDAPDRAAEQLVEALERKVRVVGSTLDAGIDPTTPRIDVLIECEHTMSQVATALARVAPVGGAVVLDVTADARRLAAAAADRASADRADSNDVFSELQEQVSQLDYDQVVEELEGVSFPGGPDPSEEVDLEEVAGVDLSDDGTIELDDPDAAVEAPSGDDGVPNVDLDELLGEGAEPDRGTSAFDDDDEAADEGISAAIEAAEAEPEPAEGADAAADDVGDADAVADDVGDADAAADDVGDADAVADDVGDVDAATDDAGVGATEAETDETTDEDADALDADGPGDAEADRLPDVDAPTGPDVGEEATAGADDGSGAAADAPGDATADEPAEADVAADESNVDAPVDAAADSPADGPAPGRTDDVEEPAERAAARDVSEALHAAGADGSGSSADSAAGAEAAASGAASSDGGAAVTGGADGSGDVDDLDPDELVDRLVAALESGEVAGQRRERLRGALGVGSTHDLDVRLEYLQKRVDNLAAYTDAWEAFLSEEGTGSQFIADVRGELDDLADRVDAAAGEAGLAERMAALEAAVDGDAGDGGDVAALAERVAALEADREAAGTGPDRDGQAADLADRMDDLEANVTAIAQSVERLAKWRESVNQVLRER